MRRIASHYTLYNGELERNIVVEVDDRGTITNILRCNAIDSMASVEFFPGILIPGMVNCHCHLELSYLKGAIAEGEGYGGFARSIGAVRNNFTTEERIRSARLADAQMWEEGVEAVADIANDDLVMEVKTQSKIEYHTLFEFFGLNNRDVEPHFDLANRYPRSFVTPHSTYSVQDEPFRQICARNSSLLSIHLLESDAEEGLYHGRGSLHEWYQRMGWECDFLNYESPAGRVAGCIDRKCRVLLVHNTRATAEDIATVESHTKNGTWVLCPESNRFISNDRPPVELLRKSGVAIAVGTDSLASARSLSMIENLRLLGNHPLRELLTWATLNGAKALGIDGMKGSIEIGKRPGLVVIEGADLHNLCLTPESVAHRII